MRPGLTRKPRGPKPTPEQRKEYERKWRIDNAERVREVCKAWRLKNPERRKELDKRFHERHPEYERERAKKRYKKDPAKWQAKAKRWMKENPFAASVLNSKYGAQRRYLIINNGGKFTKSDVEKLYQEQNGRCQYCCRELNGKFTVDHTVPLTRGGTSWPDNLQLTCRRCNIRKSNTSPDTYIGKMLSGYYGD
jgi:5-methylcytosine-specific restriction endonuclease McrA